MDITKGEWIVSGESKSLQRYHVSANGENICAIFTSLPQSEANAKAICTAVNNTYGKGYNPASLEELYKALAECREWYENNLHRIAPDTPICFSKALSILSSAKL